MEVAGCEFLLRCLTAGSCSCPCVTVHEGFSHALRTGARFSSQLSGCSDGNAIFKIFRMLRTEASFSDNEDEIERNILVSFWYRMYPVTDQILNDDAQILYQCFTGKLRQFFLSCEERPAKRPPADIGWSPHELSDQPPETNVHLGQVCLTSGLMCRGEARNWCYRRIKIPQAHTRGRIPIAKRRALRIKRSASCCKWEADVSQETVQPFVSLICRKRAHIYASFSHKLCRRLRVGGDFGFL